VVLCESLDGDILTACGGVAWFKAFYFVASWWGGMIFFLMTDASTPLVRMDQFLA